MTRQMLVLLRRSDRIEQLLPYIEQLARPGLKVVFLVHYRLARCKELTDELLAIHADIQPEFLPGRSREDNVKKRIRLAEKQLCIAREVLNKRGIEVAVSVYAGSLLRLMREYTKKEDIYLVIMRQGGGSRITLALRQIAALFRLFKPQTLPPMLLFCPSTAEARSGWGA